MERLIKHESIYSIRRKKFFVNPKIAQESTETSELKEEKIWNYQ
jgi:hypothetical protein